MLEVAIASAHGMGEGDPDDHIPMILGITKYIKKYTKVPVRERRYISR